MNQKAYEKLNDARTKEFERFKLDNIEFNSYKIERNTLFDNFANKLSDVIYETLNDDIRSDLVMNYHDGIYWMIKYEKDLYTELNSIASDVECLKDCAIIFMPNMQMLSFTNRFDDKLYGIEIYYGLFMQANLLAQAVFLEDACPDEQGKNLYQWLVQNSFSLHEKDYILKLHSQQSMNIRTSHIADLIVRFFALHELGHIALKHSGYGEQKLNEEFAADLFAMKYLLKATEGHENIWQAYSFLLLFFTMLDDINKIRQISYGHPTGYERQKKLYNFLLSTVGEASNDCVLWFNIIISKWSGIMAPSIEFKIYTQTADQILEIFDGDNYLQTAYGFRFTIAEISKKQGGIVDETIITFIVDLVENLPHDLLVAYICDKFLNQGKNIAEIDKKFTRQKDEIKKLIEDLMKKEEEKK